MAALPIPGSESQRGQSTGSPIAEAAIAQDLADYVDDERSTASSDEDGSEATTVRLGTTPRSLAGSYRRPSFFTAGSRCTVVPQPVGQDVLSRQEKEQAIEQERALLCDNNVIPSGHLQPKAVGNLQKMLGGILPQASVAADEADVESGVEEPIVRSNGLPSHPDEVPTETTSLLGPRNGDTTAIDRKWEEAVEAGLIHTTWRREAHVLTKYSAPLMLTFILQYSLSMASIFAVGHLGKVELGAVSLSSMTANITGFAVYNGLATSLDTLCAQAFGSGKKRLVGLQMQRMVLFLFVVTIPISICWFFADKILMRITPETEVAVLAGRYLKIIIWGAPGYACFESGKRYAQAQGIFTASLYVLLICAPLNAFMHWLFVWVCCLRKISEYTVLLTLSIRNGNGGSSGRPYRWPYRRTS
jgi:multidrug resistance protein, MATE family